jgi:hypothetical protein
MANTGQQETAIKIANESASYYSNKILPVFRGLDEVTVQCKEIATIAGVSAPTFSKWRAGRAKIPENKLVLLTLLLAHWFDELETSYKAQGGRTDPRLLTKLKFTRRCLYQQETINQQLPPETVREGSHLFRQWWFQEGDQSSTTPQMAS